MIIRKKRGLSPVIATILLISVALVLAVIVYLWARSFIGESIEKNGRDVSLVCENVVFSAEGNSGSGALSIVNTGVVPIYAVEMRVVGNEEISQIGQTGSDIKPGQTASFELPSELNSGDDLIVIPVLLGETAEKRKPFVCDEDYGVEIEVI
jgi:flagellin-like protein